MIINDTFSSDFVGLKIELLMLWKMVSFRSEQLRKGVYAMGFNKPSKIQETALPMLLADPWVFTKHVLK